jgi:hypothetical protein
MNSRVYRNIFSWGAGARMTPGPIDDDPQKLGFPGITTFKGTLERT